MYFTLRGLDKKKLWGKNLQLEEEGISPPKMTMSSLVPMAVTGNEPNQAARSQGKEGGGTG